MFGYVRPSVRDLPEEELDRFRAMYCGLCHTLSRRYGQAARFILNYDFTYLAILLSEWDGRGAGSRAVLYQSDQKAALFRAYRRYGAGGGRECDLSLLAVADAWRITLGPPA